ncbi:carbohydrate-binding protein [Micromonospora sp. NBC_01699]|uniref:carbohydrate-binding protein n=1 Tax=Micromonospora sp. NBC_01699 TaxID=2975984 RepID=UPI003FA55137
MGYRKLGRVSAWSRPGNHPLIASYGGNEYLRAAQGSVTVTVNPPPAWTAAKVYNNGDRVGYQGRVYQASWYAQNQKPGDPNGPWEEIAPAPPDNSPAAWTPTTVYNAGNRVAYQDHVYEAGGTPATRCRVTPTARGSRSASGGWFAGESRTPARDRTCPGPAPFARTRSLSRPGTRRSPRRSPGPGCPGPRPVPRGCR